MNKDQKFALFASIYVGLSGNTELVRQATLSNMNGFKLVTDTLAEHLFKSAVAQWDRLNPPQEASK